MEGQPLAQGKQRWEIDAARSQLGFSLRHIVVSEIHGHFGVWGGEMIFDPDYVPRTQINIWVDVATIDTGSPERDAHVRSAEFLDAKRFPRAEFISTDVTLGRDGEAVVTGRLKLHGTTRYLGLNVVAQRTWLDEDGRMRAIYGVQGRIDRQAFGLHWNQDLDIGGIVVGDKVELTGRIEVVHTGQVAYAQDTAAPASP